MKGKEMKDKLIEIFRKVNYQTRPNGLTANLATQFTDYALGEVVDAILAEGIIVPPCDVGDTVYMPWKWRGAEGIAVLTVMYIINSGARSYIRTDFTTDDEGYWEAYNRGEFDFADFGKTVFLTREEAEKALAERREG